VSGDTLSDLLRAVRLRGAVFFYLEGTAPWASEAAPATEVIPALQPDAGHMMEFHGVARGSCWASLRGEDPVRLREGDLVLFPQGDAHVLASAPELRAERAEHGIYFMPRPPQLPRAMDLSSPATHTARLQGGGEQTTLICGFIGCDARPFNPLLASLPRMLVMPGLAADGSSWIPGFLRSAVEESNHKRPGGEAVLERMTEMMFVEVLRRYVDGLPPERTGWLAGMRDPAVGRALALMHERPGEPWTLERLGEAAALSRSALHERFVYFLATPPMQYLAQWRMQLAAGWLRDTDAKVVEVALEVGYENEAAFSRAFRRMVGESPGAWRRAHRSRPKRPTAAAPPEPPAGG